MYETRIYRKENVSFFCKTKDYLGGLSNMASGYPLSINNQVINSSEALYQALRFPNKPELQLKIISQRNPFDAKRIAYKNLEKTREDWDNIKINIMRWCLRIKLAQNFLKFGLLLELTHNTSIVELSIKDSFWGAIPDNKNNLIGVNALGRLLMELRDQYMSMKRYELLVVPKLAVQNSILLSMPILKLDEKQNFIKKYIYSPNDRRKF